MRYRSIRFKLLYSFVAVILLPLFTLGILGPYISAGTVEAEITKHTAQLIQQVSKNVEQSITKMEGIVSIVAENPDVRAFFGVDGASGPFTRKNADGAHRLLGTVSRANPEIAGILLVNYRDQLIR